VFAAVRGDAPDRGMSVAFPRIAAWGPQDADAAAKAFAENRARPVNPLPVLGGWEGDDSSVTELSVERIVDTDAWTALWKRHAPDAPPPAVDFTQAMVVAIFSGATGQFVSGFSLYSVSDTNPIEIMVRSNISDVITNTTHNPYLFVVLPRSNKAITVIARSFMLMAGPQLAFKTVKELRPLPKAK
jgi:hypothetical protein